MAKINVNGTEITIIAKSQVDYLCLTDMTNGFNEGSKLTGKWITNKKNTLEYLSIWKKINNANFNYPESGVIETKVIFNVFLCFANRIKQMATTSNSNPATSKNGKYRNSKKNV